MERQPRWLQPRSWVFGIVWHGCGRYRIWHFISCTLCVAPSPLFPGPNANVCVTQKGGCPHQQASLTPAGSGIQLSSDTVYPEMGTGPLDVSPPDTPRTSDASRKSRLSSGLLTSWLQTEGYSDHLLGFHRLAEWLTQLRIILLTRLLVMTGYHINSQIGTVRWKRCEGQGLGKGCRASIP